MTQTITELLELIEAKAKKALAQRETPNDAFIVPLSPAAALRLVGHVRELEALSIALNAQYSALWSAVRSHSDRETLREIVKAESAVLSSQKGESE